MTAEIIDGKKLALESEKNLKQRISNLKEKGIVPCLAVLLAGDNQASKLYVKKKREASKRLGIESRLVELPDHVTQKFLIEQIEKLNKDDSVHGILVQLPLPEKVDYVKVIEAIDPEKDVDGFTSKNFGRLAQGVERLASCTPKGVIKLIESTGQKFEAAKVCIVGHGITVGMPLTLMLLNRGCTVTVCDKYTQNLGQTTVDAEILISCAGVPNLIKEEMVRAGAVVIDVGINRVEGSLCGDVDFKGVSEIAGFITPVPGGVGPMTVASLMENTLIAAELLGECIR